MRKMLMCFIAAMVGAAYGQTAEELAALKAQKEQLEALAGIEKAKADIAKAKQDQIRYSFPDVASAEESKKKAEAERAEFLAKLPATETKALSGSVGVEGVKLMALRPILAKLGAEAQGLCTQLGNNVLPYDKTTIDAMSASVVIERQLVILEGAYANILKPKDGGAPGRTPLLLALGGITTGVKAAADLASMFKTNVVTGKVDIAEPRSLFLTMMATHCKERLIFLPGGYQGELNFSVFDGISDLAKRVLLSKYAVERIAEEKKSELTAGKVKEKAYQDEIGPLKKKGPNLTAEEREKLAALESDLALRVSDNQNIARAIATLEDLIKQTDVFLQGLKIGDPSGSAPLLSVARHLAMSRRASAASDLQILDLDIRAEGVTLLRENIFIGQRLRIGGAAVIGYRVWDRAGKIEKAGVMPVEAAFEELNLRKK